MTSFETVDAAKWAKRNLWKLPSGELCVRPGLRRIFAVPSQRVLVGGFSVDNVFTGETWHYVFDVADTPPRALRVQILTEDFEVWQTLSLNVDMIPRVVTYGVVEGQVLVGGPDFPTLWGVIGGPLRLATKVESDNPATTALDVPRGLVSTFCNRFVIADGPSLFFSDPIAATGGDGRTFVAENQNQRPAAIYGVHEGAGGMLVVVTGAGSFGLDSSAAAVGVIGSNGTDWRLLNHHAACSYVSSCVVRGRVFALSEDGWLPVDEEGIEEVNLTDPFQSRAIGKRFSLEDYRDCRMYGDDDGPIVASDALNAAHMASLSHKIGSWWTSGYAPADFTVRGLLREPGGGAAIICGNGVFRAAGSFDGDVALSSATAPSVVVGSLSGVIPSSPMANRLVRCVSMSAEAIGTAYTAVRGDLESASLDADPDGITIGTDAWGTTSKRWTATPFSTGSMNYGGNATRDVGIEVGAEGPLTRISTLVDVSFSDSARARKGGT